jgi:leucyl/phenylalanyl-tRNA--protein transferase
VIAEEGRHYNPVITWLAPGESFPPVERAMHEPNGLLAAGGELTAERLVDAYMRGIFPWYSDDQPVLWWSPDPRFVLYVNELKVSRSLRKTIKRGGFELKVDSAFAEVIGACARSRAGQGGTWITADVAAAYGHLHRLGLAHSIETWWDGELVGGLYGVCIGRMFFGESMFAERTDASKIALVGLVRLLQRHEFPMIDCQQQTQHLARFGARPIPRSRFKLELAELVSSRPWHDPWNSNELNETLLEQA